MIDDKQYKAMRDRSRKHMDTTLKTFEFWGQKVGKIDGEIVQKWSEARWHAVLEANSVFSLLIKLFFYNLAYMIAAAKNPSCANDIILSAKHRDKIIFARPLLFAHKVFSAVVSRKTRRR